MSGQGRVPRLLVFPLVDDGFDPCTFAVGPTYSDPATSTFLGTWYASVIAHSYDEGLDREAARED
ncbi:unnamed protein product [Clonostachys rosea]|uniref:Lipocalin-like domain-containing protein n=1 Tax=Bionectria ochroleuca TaxID=29856 RepID=A0ABY6TX54_BIOOC|nr:unnamed protein product [Clonostachys rosea]